MIRAVNTTRVELFCKAEAIPLASWRWNNADGQIQSSDELTVDISVDQRMSTLKVKALSACIRNTLHFPSSLRSLLSMILN